MKAQVLQQDHHKAAVVLEDQVAQLANPAVEFSIIMVMPAVPAVLMVAVAAVLLTDQESEDLSVVMEQSELYGVQDVHSHQPILAMYN